jgi:lipid-A-disaccharide synthase-like uncharacterized protein
MKLSKKNKSILYFLIIVLGGLLAGIGYAIKVEHPVNTICFISGITLFIAGTLLFLEL